MRRLPAALLCAALLAVLSGQIAAQVPFSPDDWPQWRGPNRDGISLEQGLLKEWPKEGPPVLWQVDTVGVGYSSLAVKDGRIFTQGDLDGVEHIICLDAKDGSTLWAVQPGPVAQLLDDADRQRVQAARQEQRRQDRRGRSPRPLRLGLESSTTSRPAATRAARAAAGRPRCSSSSTRTPTAI